jgi:McrBC 5-methylcytosine restriction system component
MVELKIKDNSFVNKEDLKGIRRITENIANKTLEQLAKEGVFVFPECIQDARDIVKGQMVLQRVNQQYQTSNVMGFLGYGKEKLVIESRFSTGEQDYFFQYLLEQALEFPNILELNTNTNQDNRLFKLFLFLFPNYLRAAMRKGVFKTYIRNQYNDNNLRGTIDIARHIRKNNPFVGKVAYNQREFSYDNYLMELIRHTIEFIKRKPYGNNLLRKVKDEMEEVIKVTNSYEYYDRRKVLITNKKNPIRHAYYHEYRNLQQLCIMILQHEEHQIGYGSQQIKGILFDGAWLWEEYLNTLLKEHFEHPMNKSGSGAHYYFEKSVGKIYPDFIAHDRSSICDAKYKKVENNQSRDFHQILGYMFRFHVNAGYLLYPGKGNRELILKEHDDKVKVVKLGLAVPQVAKDYKEFEEQMKMAEQEFTRHVLERPLE